MTTAKKLPKQDKFELLGEAAERYNQAHPDEPVLKRFVNDISRGKERAHQRFNDNCKASKNVSFCLEVKPNSIVVGIELKSTFKNELNVVIQKRAIADRFEWIHKMLQVSFARVMMNNYIVGKGYLPNAEIYYSEGKVNRNPTGVLGIEFATTNKFNADEIIEIYAMMKKQFNHVVLVAYK